MPFRAWQWPDTIRTIARDLATSPAAVAYGRIGVCRGRFPTLTNYLLDALSIVTGNFDRRGGLIFGKGLLDLAAVHARLGRKSYDSVRTRVGNLPDVTGRLPYVLPEEIETTGPGQVKGLFCSAGNPVLSAPDGAALERALPTLELFVSLDHYVTETNRYAHYILPATTFLERADALLAFGGTMPRPWAHVTDAVIEPLGESRDDWAIYDVMMRMLSAPAPAPAASPNDLIDGMIAASPRGIADGWTVAKLAKHPHGVLLDDRVEVGDAGDRLSIISRGTFSRVQLGVPEVLAEVDRLVAGPCEPSELPLRLVGRRDLRGLNSWMDNVRRLSAIQPAATLHMHPDDACAAGVVDGGEAELSTRLGSQTVRVEVTDDIMAGVVSYPHGWGHQGGWRTANQHGGVNINKFLPNSVADKERLSGMSFLDGVPVRVSQVRPRSGALLVLPL